ncbi:MAG: hypothetical protein ABJF23_09740 [Bryobacteraceae bacterium]
MRTLTIFALTTAVALSQPANTTLHFLNLQTGPQFAEAATVIRSIAEIRDLRVDASERTMTMLGSPEQAAIAGFLFGRLDRTSGTMTMPDAAELDFRPSADGVDDMVRVFYWKNPKPAEDIQRMTTVIRSLTEIRKAFLSNAAGGFVVRGTQEQVDAAKWLVENLDQPSLRLRINQYRVSDAAGENVLRLFSVSKFGSEEELKNFASALRVATQMRRVFAYYPLRVIAVRSTPAQIENAERMVDRP